MTRARTWSLSRSLEWARRLGASPPKRMAASWSGSRVGPTEYKVAARSFAPDGGLPSVRCSLACFQCEYGSRYGEAGGTVLRRGKWWVLAILGPPVKNGRPCAWLRSRRASARRICQAFRSVPFRCVGTRGAPTHRRNALAARRRTRGLVLKLLPARLAGKAQAESA